MHVRCLDALRAQGSLHEKTVINREPLKQSSATEAPSLILLPYGIADSSDELTDDDDIDDLNIRTKRDQTEVKDEIPDAGNATKPANSKFRIKTGGK